MTAYVLVVDDDPDAQEILVDIVNMLDLEVRTAIDGQEGLEMVKEDVPSLILLDLMMPNLDGFGFYSRLRANLATRYVPVIVVTAYGPESINMLKLPGVNDVVQKGQFTIDGVIALISETLQLNQDKSGV
jgi:CheY-like chemotaxis protein